MLVTIGEIIQRFRTHGRCVKFSPETITHMAKILRFTKKRIGGKIGYDQSLITAITQRLNDAMAYENSLKQKTPQKPLKQPQMGDYYTYNGERDNVDYEWEKDNDELKTEGMIVYYNENNSSKKIHINESALNLLVDKGFKNTNNM